MYRRAIYYVSIVCQWKDNSEIKINAVQLGSSCGRVSFARAERWRGSQAEADDEIDVGIDY